MRELVEALKKIGIDDFIKSAKKEADAYFIRGLFECGNSMNKNILIVEECLKRLTN